MVLKLVAQALKGENEVCVATFSADCLIGRIWVKIMMKDSFLMSPVGKLELTFMKLYSLI